MENESAILTSLGQYNPSVSLWWCREAGSCLYTGLTPPPGALQKCIGEPLPSSRGKNRTCASLTQVRIALCFYSSFAPVMNPLSGLGQATIALFRHSETVQSPLFQKVWESSSNLCHFCIS